MSLGRTESSDQWDPGRPGAAARRGRVCRHHGIRDWSLQSCNAMTASMQENQFMVCVARLTVAMKLSHETFDWLVF